MTLPSIENLRCFLEAARALNFRKAARSVALTPTAFGQRLKQLEEQVGAQLFVRTTRAVSLTEKGLALVPLAERCLEAARACASASRGEGDPPEMVLTIGTRQELGLSWLLPIRRALKKKRPWLDLHLYVSSGPDLLLRIRTHEIDCAVTSTPVGDPRLDALQLHREDYALVASPSLLAERPLKKPEDAARHTLLDVSPDLPLFRYFRDAIPGGDRFRFARGSWLGGIAAIRFEARDGAGVAVLPEYFVRDDLAKRRLVRALPKAPMGHDYFRLVFRAGDPRRGVLESLAHDLSAHPLR